MTQWQTQDFLSDMMRIAGPPVQEPVATTSNDEEDDRADALELAARWGSQVGMVHLLMCGTLGQLHGTWSHTVLSDLQNLSLTELKLVQMYALSYIQQQSWHAITRVCVWNTVGIAH
jgi:hypothetical protein